jgi:hypothetical protein
MDTRRIQNLFVIALFTGLAITNAHAQQYKADVPKSITTPDSVETRIGTLKFADGIPDEETVKKVYDQLDFGRGVEAFMAGMPAGSIYAICEGTKKAGAVPNKGIAITEDLGDARSLFLTANSTTVYLWFCIDVKDGPVVFEAPPKILGMVDDAYFRFVSDVGTTGPDKGAGGKYLFVPPDYKGALPETGYFIARTPTYTNMFLLRRLVEKGDIAGAVKDVKANARVYPLSAAANPAALVSVNISGKQINTIHANDFHFYEELNAVVQHEPADAFDPETAGLFASLGIKKGQPFAPDARMKAILTDAVAVGNATSRAILFASRDARTKIYPDRQWFTPFSFPTFLDNGERVLDARTMMHYFATGITPSMVMSKPGTGSAYGLIARDSQGRYFDGGKNYKITLPAPIPAANFWSFMVYDNQTRSILETDQRLGGIDSNQQGIKMNTDGSATVYFGPKAPSGQEGNWVQTMPGKGWNAIIRLYGPLQPWFDKTWKPGDFELVK